MTVLDEKQTKLQKNPRRNDIKTFHTPKCATYPPSCATYPPKCGTYTLRCATYPLKCAKAYHGKPAISSTSGVLKCPKYI